MADNDFIIEEPETLDISPVKKEEVIITEPKEEIISFEAQPVKTEIQPVNIEPEAVNVDIQPVNVEVQPEVVEPVEQIVQFDIDGASFAEPTSLNQELEVKEESIEESVSTNESVVSTPEVAPVLEQTVETESLNINPVTEENVIKEVATATPNKINDDVLKVEDTLLTNNLKEEIKKFEDEKDEELQNRRAIRFIVAIFALLGLTILLLPVLTNVFN